MTKGQEEEFARAQRGAAYGNDEVPFEGSVSSSMGQVGKIEKPKGDKMDGEFLVLDGVKKDPAAFFSAYNFEVSDYLIENNDIAFDSQFLSLALESKDDFHLKIESYYIMKYEHVFGMLILKKDCIVFSPDLNKN